MSSKIIKTYNLFSLDPGLNDYKTNGSKNHGSDRFVQKNYKIQWSQICIKLQKQLQEKPAGVFHL